MFTAASRTSLTMLIVLGTALTAPLAHAADDAVKAVLQSRYSDMKTAMAVRDGAAIGAILAPNFVSVDVSGQSETAAQMISEVSALKPDPNRSSETMIVSLAQGQPNKAVVQQRYDDKTVRAMSDNNRHNVELVALSTDTWIKQGNVWLLQQTVTNELSYYVDGKLSLHKVKQ